MTVSGKQKNVNFSFALSSLFVQLNKNASVLWKWLCYSAKETVVHYFYFSSDRNCDTIKFSADEL